MWGGGGALINAEIVIRSLETDLQRELIAGVSTVEFGAGEPELPVRQGGGSGVPVAHLPQRLLVAGHGVHASGSDDTAGSVPRLKSLVAFFLSVASFCTIFNTSSTADESF